MNATQNHPAIIAANEAAFALMELASCCVDLEEAAARLDEIRTQAEADDFS